MSIAVLASITVAWWVIVAAATVRILKDADCSFHGFNRLGGR